MIVIYASCAVPVDLFQPSCIDPMQHSCPELAQAQQSIARVNALAEIVGIPVNLDDVQQEAFALIAKDACGLEPLNVGSPPDFRCKASLPRRQSREEAFLRLAEPHVQPSVRIDC